VLIEDYFQQIEQAIAQSYIVVDSQFVTDKRSLYIGFIEGTLTFLDGSTLHFMEFVNVKMTVNRYKYSYHYQDTTETLIFRYDMAPHHRDVSTFPHHKHTANGQVIDAMTPSLPDVLEDIERMAM
jgi:hypothetical protein